MLRAIALKNVLLGSKATHEGTVSPSALGTVFFSCDYHRKDLAPLGNGLA